MSALANEPLIEISGLKFAYGPREILKGVNLKIHRGKVVAILGTSGSGKTTLLRMVGGQLRPDEGYVKVAGQTVHELDDAALYLLRRQTGMMFQKGGLVTDRAEVEQVGIPIDE